MGTDNKEILSTAKSPGPPPQASSADALARMKSQRQRDTKPEILLRFILHRMGYRYRVDITPLPGMKSRADIVFPKIRVAVFVDGCFWHSCPQHGTLPKKNAKWWRTKLALNVSRDRQVNELLCQRGWEVVRIWEHEDPQEVAHRIIRILKKCYAANKN